MKAEDLAAISGSLRDIGKQLKDITKGMSAVKAEDKIAPDDKSVAQRAIESELQKKTKSANAQIG